jgi:hypothetical protein
MIWVAYFTLFQGFLHPDAVAPLGARAGVSTGILPAPVKIKAGPEHRRGTPTPPGFRIRL